MAEAPPLSLRDRIRQLEQAAHSPLTDGSSTLTSKGPTSSPRLHKATAAHSLTVQQVAHADDPLQQSVDAPRLPPAASPSTRTSGRSAPPPPKPPRPVWVTSKAREAPAAPASIDTGSKVETGRGERGRTSGGGGNPLTATLARSSDAASGGEHPSTQASLQSGSRPTSPSGSISPTSRSKPTLPARPPAATVPSPILSDPPRPRSVSACSDVLDQVEPSRNGTSAAPALPPRPAWARKPSPAASPGSLPIDGSRGSPPAPPSSHLGRRDSALRDTASSAAGSTGGHSLATFPAAGAFSGSSSSPALPPRPPRAPPSPAPQKTDTKSSAVVAGNARRRYDRLFSQCLEAAATARPSPGSEERLDGAVIGELWRRSRLDDALLRRIWCVRSVFLLSPTIQFLFSGAFFQRCPTICAPRLMEPIMSVSRTPS